MQRGCPSQNELIDPTRIRKSIMAINNEQTLSQIQSLARLYQTGYRSPIIDASIQKLITLERARLQRELEELQEHLHAFEEEYHLSSEEFHHQFQKGELGDDADMFEWDAFYQMMLTVKEQLETLQPETASQ